MPRFDHRVQAAHLLRPGDTVLVDLLLAEINVLREALNLPPRTVADVHETLCTSVRTQARPPHHERGN